MAKYVNITAQDTLLGTSKVTKGLFPGDVGVQAGTGLSTSSISTTQRKYYHNLQVSDTDVMSVTYGHVAGSGSSGEQTNTFGETRAIYKQFMTTLQNYDDADPGDVNLANLIINDATESAFYAIVFERARMKDRVNKKNWTLHLSGSGHHPNSGSDLRLTDDSEYSASIPTPAGPRFNVVSGSAGTKIGTTIFRLSDHVDRLFDSAEAYNLKIPFDKEVITNAIKDSVHLNNLSSAYIRPLVFFGEGEMGLLPKSVPVYVSVAAWNWGAYLGDDAGNQGVRVCISKWKRISPQSFKPTAKGVGGYMNSTLAKVDAVENGYDDAIMLGDNDVVAEGSGQNLFLIKNGKIYTPPIETGALGGITRKTVIEIANNLGLETEETNINAEQLKDADELFFTGTATEVVGVVSVDGEDITGGKPGEITGNIRQKYLEIVNGENEDFLHYLTLVK